MRALVSDEGSTKCHLARQLALDIERIVLRVGCKAVRSVKQNERSRRVTGSAQAIEGCRSKTTCKPGHGLSSPNKSRRYAVVVGNHVHRAIISLNESSSVQAIGVALGIKNPVGGPDHGFVVQGISKPDARAEVPVIRVEARGVRGACDLERPGQVAGTGVRHRQVNPRLLIVLVDVGGEEVPAETQVQSELAGDLEIVLGVGGEIRIARITGHRFMVGLGFISQPEEEACERDSCRRVAWLGSLIGKKIEPAGAAA